MKHSMRYFLSVLIIFVSLLCASVCAFAQDSRPRLGLAVSPMQVSPLLLQHLRLAEGEGVMVSNVAVGGELEAAGLSQGDILLAVDGHPLEKPSDLTNYIAGLPKDTQVTLDVIQKGEHRQIYVKLDNLPDEIVWKYAAPVSDPGRGRLGSRSGNQGQIQLGQGSGGFRMSGSQQSVFHSIQMTDSGMRSVTVTIHGPSDDPNSEIEVVIGQDSYETHIGEIDKLPPEARDAAQMALDSRGQFSFGGSNDLFEEMMRRQMEQMRMMDEMFNQSFGAPNNRMNQKKSGGDAPKPVAPDPNDIRS